ncbi:M1 family metallopeptidase [Streptomyces sp. NPDC002577]
MLFTPCTKAPPANASRTFRIGTVLLAPAACAALIAASAPLPAAPSSGSPRAAGPPALGVGDRLFPYLGNPGYDVTSYDISLTYRGDNSKPLDAVTKIVARATSPLMRFNLDFGHGTVRSVEVNGEPARFTKAGEDLVVTPFLPLARGSAMRVTVRHTSNPVSPDKVDGGWVRTKDGLAMANQADAAHRVFPCNDHPSDKALFTFRITAPSNVTAVAGGVPAGKTRAGSTTTWAYRTLHPMATELAQVSIGKSSVLYRTGPHGLVVRDVVPTKDRKVLEPWLKKTPDQISWLERRVGRYPFERYGVLVAEAQTGFELETQTLSLFERELFTVRGRPAWTIESIMLHELAHQWFGDSVSPRTWSDLWLNEGHATWYEALYAAEKGGPSLDERMRAAYGQSDSWRASGGPPAAPKAPEPGQKISIFRPIVYDGSALALYALRQEIGRAAFEQLERTWVDTYRDGTATTADFISLASRISGRDLRGFLDAWLYGTKTPPMPGHPDWHTEAAGNPARSPR